MSERLTVLLSRMADGDRAARDALFVAAYRSCAAWPIPACTTAGRNTVLDTTALVHESYLRLVQTGELQLRGSASVLRLRFAGDAIGDRRHAPARDGRAARRRCAEDDAVDRSRERTAAGRGQAIVQVHEALQELEQADARAAQMVEMRYFGGYSDKEIADTLESPSARCSATGRRPRCCCGRSCGPTEERSVMKLSTEQLARMSRLLDEVVDADEAAAAGVAASACRRASRPRAGVAARACCRGRAGLPPRQCRLDAAAQLGAGGDVTAASGLKEGDLVGPYRLTAAAGGRRHGRGVAGAARRWRLQARGGAQDAVAPAMAAGPGARASRSSATSWPLWSTRTSRASSTRG